MKTVSVVAAIIERDGKILATQRGYGDMAGGWEFPGGKIEPSETPEEALIREIREELDVAIAIERPIATVDYDYETFHLHMLCYLAHLDPPTAELQLVEHSAATWLDAATIDTVPWLPADVELVREIVRQGVC